MRVIEVDGFGQRRIIYSNSKRKSPESIIAWSLKGDPPTSVSKLARFRERGTWVWMYIDPLYLMRKAGLLKHLKKEA